MTLVNDSRVRLTSKDSRNRLTSKTTLKDESKRLKLMIKIKDSQL